MIVSGYILIDKGIFSRLCAKATICLQADDKVKRRKDENAYSELKDTYDEYP